MNKPIISSLLVVWLMVASPAAYAAQQGSESAAQQDFSEAWDEITRALRRLADRARGYFSFSIRTPNEERPLISIMLRNRERLALSDEQVRKLERLRDDFERESIRREADLRIAEIDLDRLIGATNVDMAKVESKIREIQRWRADQRLERIRSMEKGKAQLAPEQRNKLRELLSESQVSRLPPARQ